MRSCWVGVVLLVSGCAIAPGSVPISVPSKLQSLRHQGNEIVFYALGLIDVGYRFGGKNPDSGLDCSGMVSYIYGQAVGMKLPYNAAQLAQSSRPIKSSELRPGDLVFFNTMNKPFSHVGIYIGEDKFVHAPSRNGKIRVNSLKSEYYAKRFEAARTLFD